MSLSKNKGMAIEFVSPIGGKIQQNVVLRDLKENSHSDKIIFKFMIFAN